ncbi:MAG TPA: GAF domain-containing protein [Pyrinomonadaceae bacterium]|jgi:GAF domain-containing protein/signal transduction histidine kinase
MPEGTLGLDLLELFSSLTEIPLSCSDRNEALKQVTRLGQQALGSHACALTFTDVEKRTLTYVACTGFDREFEELMVGRTITMSPAGAAVGHLDFNLIAKGEPIECYRLQHDGQGLANPEIARKYNLKAVLGYPLKSQGQLIGYFSHFSASDEPFSARDKSLLEIFARQAVNTIERFEHYQAFDGSLNILRDVAQSLPSVSPDEFIRQVPVWACALLSAPTCIVRKLDEQREQFRVIAATDDVDDAFKDLELRPDDQGIKYLLINRKAGQLFDITKPSRHYVHHNEAKERGWASLLTTPLWVRQDLVGSLDIYARAPRRFKRWEVEFFETFASYVALAIHKADLLRESEEILTSQQRLEKLNELMQPMTEMRDPDELLKFLLDEGLKLTGADRGWVSRLDVKTGKLLFVEERGDPPQLKQLQFGEGITGKSLKTGVPIRIDDINNSEHASSYEEFWPDTVSELAIPLIVNNAQVRVGRKVELGSKPIGVLNLESRDVAAFSQADEDALWPLARQAALLIERLEIDRKLTDLRSIERQFFGMRDWDAIIQIVLKGITDTLGFEFVNVSLVNHELNRIKTEHVIGISKKEAEEFKRMAVHSLDSNDIQADVVRSREIEVPQPDDRRFDSKIFNRFGHAQMTRVFIPMIVPSDDRVIGTVEAGYQTSHRKHIYERDVQILQGFVDYAVEALEHKRSGLLDRISHEFRAPIVGIRSNASFLQRRVADLRGELIDAKFNDVLLDCEILLYQVAELEYILGRPLPISKPEKTLVYKDVIIKTINQLKPIVLEYDLAITRIEYNPADSARIILNVDRAKLGQVVYNLLINSIKYAESDPSQFTIRIAVDETKDKFTVKFKDWGIGIQEGLKEKVFDEGFRTPEAMRKNVNGSGLGLTIARKIMREIGGDLTLAGHRKPTEFHMVLPKSLKGGTHDSVR